MMMMTRYGGKFCRLERMDLRLISSSNVAGNSWLETSIQLLEFNNCLVVVMKDDRGTPIM